MKKIKGQILHPAGERSIWYKLYPLRPLRPLREAFCRI